MTEPRVETKPLPAIATRAIKLQWLAVQRVLNVVSKEAADIAGVNLAEGWKLNDDATAFVRPKPEPPKSKEES